MTALAKNPQPPLSCADAILPVVEVVSGEAWNGCANSGNLFRYGGLVCLDTFDLH